MPNDLIPFSDDQAKLGVEALKTLREAGGYIGKVLGTLPEDVVGMLGGDAIRVKRAENLARMIEGARERLKEREVEAPQPVPLSVGVPLLQASADESRDRLRDLWARLLAAAMDPSRCDGARVEYIETIKGLNPIDAVIFDQIQHVIRDPVSSQSLREKLSAKLGISSGQVEVALLNLHRLGCIQPIDVPINEVRVVAIASANLTVYGRELLRVLQD